MTTPDPQRVERKDTRASLIEEMQKAFRVRTIFDGRIANDIFDRIAALSAADAIQPPQRDEVLNAARYKGLKAVVQGMFGTDILFDTMVDGMMAEKYGSVPYPVPEFADTRQWAFACHIAQDRHPEAPYPQPEDRRIAARRLAALATTTDAADGGETGR